jgi:hypothetical protein
MQKPIEGLSVLPVFSAKKLSQHKKTEGKRAKKTIGAYPKVQSIYKGGYSLAEQQSQQNPKKAILKSSLRQIHNRAEGTFYGARTHSLNSRVRTTKNSR